MLSGVIFLVASLMVVKMASGVKGDNKVISKPMRGIGLGVKKVYRGVSKGLKFTGRALKLGFRFFKKGSKIAKKGAIGAVGVGVAVKTGDFFAKVKLLNKAGTCYRRLRRVVKDGSLISKDVFKVGKKAFKGATKVGKAGVKTVKKGIDYLDNGTVNESYQDIIKESEDVGNCSTNNRHIDNPTNNINSSKFMNSDSKYSDIFDNLKDLDFNNSDEQSALTHTKDIADDYRYAREANHIKSQTKDVPLFNTSINQFNNDCDFPKNDYVLDNYEPTESNKERDEIAIDTGIDYSTNKNKEKPSSDRMDIFNV